MKHVLFKFLFLAVTFVLFETKASPLCRKLFLHSHSAITEYKTEKLNRTQLTEKMRWAGFDQAVKLIDSHPEVVKNIPKEYPVLEIGPYGNPIGHKIRGDRSWFVWDLDLQSILDIQNTLDMRVTGFQVDLNKLQFPSDFAKFLDENLNQYNFPGQKVQFSAIIVSSVFNYIDAEIWLPRVYDMVAEGGVLILSNSNTGTYEHFHPTYGAPNRGHYVLDLLFKNRNEVEVFTVEPMQTKFDEIEKYNLIVKKTKSPKKEFAPDALLARQETDCFTSNYLASHQNFHASRPREDITGEGVDITAFFQGISYYTEKILKNPLASKEYQPGPVLDRSTYWREFDRLVGLVKSRDERAIQAMLRDKSNLNQIVSLVNLSSQLLRIDIFPDSEPGYWLKAMIIRNIRQLAIHEIMGEESLYSFGPQGLVEFMARAKTSPSHWALLFGPKRMRWQPLEIALALRWGDSDVIFALERNILSSNRQARSSSQKESFLEINIFRKAAKIEDPRQRWIFMKTELKKLYDRLNHPFSIPILFEQLPNYLTDRLP